MKVNKVRYPQIQRVNVTKLECKPGEVRVHYTLYDREQTDGYWVFKANVHPEEPYLKALMLKPGDEVVAWTVFINGKWTSFHQPIVVNDIMHRDVDDIYRSVMLPYNKAKGQETTRGFAWSVVKSRIAMYQKEQDEHKAARDKLARAKQLYGELFGE